ncbi:hypothetical protein JW978_00045 [Candidatus Dojkabacteria bacterium]|nr:hypothetical protein [Candidatus Dojkabacteria bacterium]
MTEKEGAFEIDRHLHMAISRFEGWTGIVAEPIEIRVIEKIITWMENINMCATSKEGTFASGPAAALYFLQRFYDFPWYAEGLNQYNLARLNEVRRRDFDPYQVH